MRSSPTFSAKLGYAGFSTAMFVTLWPAVAFAQTIIQSEVELYDQSAGGKPAICGVQFTTAFRDDLSDNGGVGAATGSINLAVQKGRLVAFAKVAATKGALQINVLSATLKADGSFIELKNTGCNDPRNFCGAAYNEDSVKVFLGLASGRFEVRYQIVPNGLDYAIPVDARHAKNATAAQGDYDACIRSLISQVRG